MKTRTLTVGERVFDHENGKWGVILQFENREKKVISNEENVDFNVILADENGKDWETHLESCYKCVPLTFMGHEVCAEHIIEDYPYFCPDLEENCYESECEPILKGTGNQAAFEEKLTYAKKNIPASMFTEDIGSMYENVLEWCRDQFNEPKDPMLAMAIIGNFMVDSLSKVNKNRREYLMKLRKGINIELKKLNLERINRAIMNINRFPLSIENIINNDEEDLEDTFSVWIDVEGRNGETYPGRITEIRQDSFTITDDYGYTNNSKYENIDEMTLDDIADMLETLETLIAEKKVVLNEETRTPYIGREFKDGKVKNLFGPEETYYEVIANN